MVRRALVLIPAAVGALLFVLPALGKSPAGTGITASKTATGHLTSTYAWTIGKSADPSSQMVAVGTSATVHWTITVGRSASGALGAYLDGQVCVSNTGSVATQGLAISDQLTKPPSGNVLNTVTVDVSANPVLAAGQSWCYPYKITVPAAAIVAGAIYKDTARVTITNQSGSPGTPRGPSPSATVALSTSPTAVDSSISVSDTNGQTFSFSSGGSQGYDQTVACTNAAGAHTITDDNTATIASTGQTAKGTATVHCGAPTTLTTALSSSSIHTGGSVTDQATITGAATNAAGTITYKVYTDSSCSGTPSADATPTSNTVSNAQAPASKSVTFDTAGTYYWQAVYSGDAEHNTLGSTSDCTAEKLTVTSCTPGTIGCPWNNGDLTTYNQPGWGGDPGGVVTTNYNHVYAGTGGVFEVGISGSSGFSIMFTDGVHLVAYLPAVGTAAALDADVINPTSTASGTFGGEVVALKLNIDFSDAGLVSANSGLKFGDLTICKLTSDTDLNGKTVRQFLGVVNTALGGGSTTDPITDLDPITADLNVSFGGGTVSTWAQQHLDNGACGWHDGALTTYTQTFWSDDATASANLSNNYNTVYGSNFGVVEVGIPGAAGFSMQFSDPSNVLAYLPASGTAAALVADVLNPTSSSSGLFGGDVLALQFNIDFSDAGFLSGTAGVAFGNLTLCGLSATPNLNGLTVRQFRDQVNTALGGGAASYDIATLQPITASLNASFGAGAVSSFAQDHVVNGACP